VLRLAMLRTHYRQPIDWTVRALEEAEATLRSWHVGISEASRGGGPNNLVLHALQDDLNTPGALAELHTLKRTGQMTSLAQSLSFLGLLNEEIYGVDSRRIQPSDITPENRQKIETWIDARTTARSAKNWAESDRIRDELAAMGIAVKDNKDGTTTWEVARWEEMKSEEDL
jgi:cysteinyl-tRNA synthetase